MRKSPLMFTLAKGYKHKSKLLSPIKWGRLCNLVRYGKIAEAEQLLFKWKLKNGKAWLVHSLINLSHVIRNLRITEGNLVIFIFNKYYNSKEWDEIFLSTDSKEVKFIHIRRRKL